VADNRYPQGKKNFASRISRSMSRPQSNLAWIQARQDCSSYLGRQPRPSKLLRCRSATTIEYRYRRREPGRREDNRIDFVSLGNMVGHESPQFIRNHPSAFYCSCGSYPCRSNCNTLSRHHPRRSRRSAARKHNSPPGPVCGWCYKTTPAMACISNRVRAKSACRRGRGCAQTV
jgi:hypothetical protein